MTNHIIEKSLRENPNLISTHQFEGILRNRDGRALCAKNAIDAKVLLNTIVSEETMPEADKVRTSIRIPAILTIARKTWSDGGICKKVQEVLLDKMKERLSIMGVKVHKAHEGYFSPSFALNLNALNIPEIRTDLKTERPIKLRAFPHA